MGKHKQQGTALETGVVAAARAFRLVARRLAEGGAADEGDVEVYDAGGGRWVIECKARAALSLHEAFCKAQRKAPLDRVAVVWKRLVLKDGNTRRTAAGPTLVALTLESYLDLLSRAGDARDEDTAA